MVVDELDEIFIRNFTAIGMYQCEFTVEGLEWAKKTIELALIEAREELRSLKP